MQEKKEPKANYAPPGWLVTNFTVRLSEEQAVKFQDLREHLCKDLGENHIDHPEVALNALAQQAFDLLLAHYEAKPASG